MTEIDVRASVGSRMDALRAYIPRLPKGALLVETGRLRNASDAHRAGDGWSTAVLASMAEQLGGSLVSIDIDARTESIVRSVLDTQLLSRIDFVNADSVAALSGLRHRACNLVLLDSARDPGRMMAEFGAVSAFVPVGGLLVLDDAVVKGACLVPYLDRRDQRKWQCLRSDDPRVYLREEK